VTPQGHWKKCSSVATKVTDGPHARWPLITTKGRVGEGLEGCPACEWLFVGFTINNFWEF